MKSCSESSCPFAYTEESENIQNLGCLPSPYEIVSMRVDNNKTWACHSDNTKPCSGAIKYMKKHNIDSSIVDNQLVTELDDWPINEYGIGNEVIPFKNRTLDKYKKVRVYRNLNRKGKVYSIMQNDLVVAHTTRLSLYSCKFIVKQAGKTRALKTKQRNVHAYIEGYIRKSSEENPKTLEQNNISLKYDVKYFPFNNNNFITQNNVELKDAVHVVINKTGVSADHINSKIHG